MQQQNWLGNNILITKEIPRPAKNLRLAWGEGFRRNILRILPTYSADSAGVSVLSAAVALFSADMSAFAADS